MRVEKDELIAGVLAANLRRVFRTMRGRTYRHLDELHVVLSESFGLAQAQVKALLEQLIAAGYIQHTERGHTLSDQGLRLAAASTGKPIPRAKAEQLLAELLNRARVINQGDSWYRVARIELFGSLLDASRATVNDIDLMVTLAPRYLTTDAHEDLVLMEQYRHVRTGKEGGTLMELLRFPTEEVFRQLKAGKRAYQLIDPSNHDRLRARTAYTIVFEDLAEPLPLPATLR